MYDKTQEIYAAVLKINYVRVKGSSLKVLVSNIGDVDLVIDKVLIEREGVLYELNIEGGEVIVKANDVAEIKVKLPKDLKNGVYSIKVRMRKGTVVSLPYYFRYIRVERRVWLEGVEL